VLNLSGFFDVVKQKSPAEAGEVGEAIQTEAVLHLLSARVW